MEPTLDGTDWKVLEAKSHWLSLASEVGDDGLHWWSASVKWDGCVEIHRAHNVPLGIIYFTPALIINCISHS